MIQSFWSYDMKFVGILLLVVMAACSGTETKSAKETGSSATETEETKPIDPPVQALIEYEPKVLKPEEIVAPLQAIKDLDKKVESYHLGKNLTPEKVKQNSELKRDIIRGTFDIRELCRLSLGGHWKEINKKQQSHFVELMTTLLETKAIFSKEQLRGDNKLYKISYNKEKFDDKEKTKSTVYTVMNVPKEKMKLDITYKLLLTPYGWKIYDVIVDDASLLANYKFQFHRIITKNGFNDLMGRMEKKLKDIKKK